MDRLARLLDLVLAEGHKREGTDVVQDRGLSAKARFLIVGMRHDDYTLHKRRYRMGIENANFIDGTNSA